MIQIPAIETNKYTKFIARIIDQYFVNYNKEVEQHNSNLKPTGVKRQKLLGTHMHTLWFLIFAVRNQMSEYNQLFKDTPQHRAYDSSQPYVLKMARSTFELNQGKTGRTLFNHIKRLTEAGIILNKVNHSHRYAFDLHINPHFLIVTDWADYTLWKNGKMLHVEGEPEKVSALYSTPLHVHKNKIMNVDKTASCLKSHEQNQDSKNSQGLNQIIKLHEQNATGTITVSNVNGSGEIHSTLQQEISSICGRGRRASVENTGVIKWWMSYKLAMARIILAYALEKLWPGDVLWRNGNEISLVCQAEKDRTLNLIANYMFPKGDKLNNKNENLAYSEEVVQWAKACIDQSRKLLDKKNYEKWFVYPSLYFDPSYKKGLYRTKDFILSRNEEKKKRKTLNKKRKLLHECAQEYCKLPTLPNFNRQMNHIKNSCPELLGEYLELVKAANFKEAS
jgi:hypothetical protein